MVIENNIEKYICDNYIYYLEDFGNGKGKVMIDCEGDAYSYYWSAMGSSLKDFLKQTSKDYFVNKMINDYWVFDEKKTFKNIRARFREDIPFWAQMNFQKEFRKELNEFQSTIICGDHLINEFRSFVDNLPYHLIDESSYSEHYDKRDIEDSLDNISDYIYEFIETKPSNEYKAMCKNFIKFKKMLNKK